MTLLLAAVMEQRKNIKEEWCVTRPGEISKGESAGSNLCLTSNPNPFAIIKWALT